MKKIQHLLCLTGLAAVWALGFPACSDKEDPLAEANPQVTLEAGPVSSASITFTVTPADATSCAFMYVRQGGGIYPLQKRY